MKRSLLVGFVLAFLCEFVAAQTPAELIRSAREELAKNDHAAALKLVSKAIADDPKNLVALSLRATIHERLDKYTDVVADYSRILAIDKTLASAWQDRGSANFKAGKIGESIADFDQYIALNPGAKISHWQRGISYYYAGKFDEGTKQFEGYQDFDSNDVENAVWRFMCMTRKVGMEKSRKAMLKIGDDRRVPMRQVYDLYKGDLKPADVLAAAKAGNPDPVRLSRQLFYAHLYVGIYYDLLGDTKQALDHLNKATNDHRIGHYMWDVARVHRDLLAKSK